MREKRCTPVKMTHLQKKVRMQNLPHNSIGISDLLPCLPSMPPSLKGFSEHNHTPLSSAVFLNLG